MDTASQIFVTFFLLQLLILVGCEEGGQGHKSELAISSARLKNSGWKPGNNTYLVSPNGTFSAGFYNVSPNNYAFAVWYANDPQRTVAWMANRDHLGGYKSSLTLKDGNLTISDSDAREEWSAAIPASNAEMDMVLLESGNLVFNTSNERHVWQSFDFPTFTLLPTQQLSENSRLVSRRNASTYASGVYIFSASQPITQTPSLYYNRSELGLDQLDFYWALHWALETNIDAFSLGVDGYLSLGDAGNLVNSNNSKILMALDSGNPAGPLRRLTLDHDGNLRIYSWKGDSSSSWEVVWEAVQERCKIHGTCGDNAICKTPELNDSTPECQCPPGFHRNSTDPRSCQRIIQFPRLSCNSNYQSVDYQFIPLDYVNFTGQWNQTNRNVPRLEDCMSACLNNCGCLGFSHKLDGSGYCVHLFGRLMNGFWSPESETRTYLKLSAEEKNVSNPYTGMLSVQENVCEAALRLPFPPNNSENATRDLIIICSIFGIELFCGVLAFWAFLRKYSKYRHIAEIFSSDIVLNLSGGGPKRFAYAELKAATNHFSDEVGRGGFGTVYRGVLPDQRQIAVKKLKGVSQGEEQFWAEVTIIGRIHHLNLVRMWGFCTEGEHRLLVYEYIPNGSLDKYFFDNQGGGERVVLDWSRRYRIAVGVARAIAYMHEECLEWVLHRDIKPENILLDEAFCPKISDFGLAKLVERERSLSVSNIRGTPGYLAPEYWIQENQPITAKVDVYSFGIVLLQIVSGRKNLCFSQSTDESDEWFFPKMAFEWAVLGRHMEEVVDKNIVSGARDDRFQLEAIERMVKTAFWCIQSRPDDRPSMGNVAKMLQGTLAVPKPPQPNFFLNFLNANSSEYGDHIQELPPLSVSTQEI